MALFEFPPFDASGSTGFLDPALAYQARDASAQPAMQKPGGFNWGAGSNVWPLLMGLGAGLAGGGGWGEGISKGLFGGATLANQQRENQIKERAYQMQLMELQNNLRHQRVMEGISGQNAATSEKSLEHTIEARRADDARADKKVAGYVSIINAEAPKFQAAASEILSGKIATLTGTGTTSIMRLVNAIAGITGEKVEDLKDLYVPAATDREDTRREKLGALSAYLSNLRPQIASNPTLGGSVWPAESFAVPGTQAMPAPGGGGQPVRAGEPVRADAASAAGGGLKVPVQDADGNKLWYDYGTGQTTPRQ